MSYLYVAALHFFEITQDIKTPIKIGNDILLTNNFSHFAKYITPEQYISMGVLESNFLKNGNPVIFSTQPTNSIDDAKKHTIKFMRECLAFLHALWLVEDNSANIDLAFAFSNKEGHLHSNSISRNFWTCNGKRKSFSTTVDGLIKINNEFSSKFIGMSVDAEPEFTMQRKEIKRANIGINFLQQARSTPDLGIKIANYCSFFESMISTSNSELSHQMAERIAFYLRSASDERLAIYKELKQAYNIRSKVVHGDFISNKDLTRLNEIAESCDIIARELSLKYLSDDAFSYAVDDSSNDSLDKFFLYKIFGTNNIQITCSN